MHFAKAKTVILALHLCVTSLALVTSTKRRQANQDAELVDTSGECEACKLTNEVEEVTFLLKNCENELEDLKQKLLTQGESESSSSLSYLGQVCSWVTASNQRSAPLRSTVRRFLQTLQLDDKKSAADIDDIYHADIRYGNYSIIACLI